MGTWGVNSFDNDDAVEWAAAYREMGLSVAASTIRVALQDHANNRLSADIAARAIAATEAIAHAMGCSSTEGAKLFAGAPQAAREEAEALVSVAGDLIASVTNGSALAEHWKQTDQHQSWLDALTELNSRLNGAEAAAPSGAEPVPVSDADLLEGICEAIGELSREIAAMRQDMNENMARLAARMDGTNK